MMSLNSERDLRALVEARYNQTQELEKKLRTVLTTKGPLDPAVRDIRNNLRETYEYIILTNHEFAESHDVEFALWRLNYKRIEEFRMRIRKQAAAPAQPTPVAVAGSRGGQVARREALQKLVAVFRSFLAEASGFYHDLISKLKAKHGLSRDHSFSDAELQSHVAAAADADLRLAEIRRCQVSCHRCLIYLGDLARYKELHGNGDPIARDWSVAAGYYLQAASIWPASGNPHNQLAVLATYVDDELLAVYRYYRSLAVDVPFPTARENLVLLFEKNRQRYAGLPDPGSGPLMVSKDTEKGPTPVVGDKIVATGQGDMKLAIKNRSPSQQSPHGANSVLLTKLPELQKSFRIRFVRLNGIIFTKTSMETFGEVFSATMRELEEILSLDDSSLEAGLGSQHRSGIGSGSGGAAGVVQLVAILIFTLHNISWAPEAHQPTYAEILQRSDLFQHAFTALFECGGRLVRRLGGAGEPLRSALLPAVLVLLEWLAGRSEMAVGSEVQERQAKARVFFWGQVVHLLNLLLEKSAVWQPKGPQGQEGGALLAEWGGPEEKEDGRTPLWEDHELRGFQPLVPVQRSLDYSKPTSRLGAGDLEQQQLRLRRLLGAARQLAKILKGSKRGLWFDEEVQRYALVGQIYPTLLKSSPAQATPGNEVLQDSALEKMPARASSLAEVGPEVLLGGGILATAAPVNGVAGAATGKLAVEPPEGRAPVPASGTHPVAAYPEASRALSGLPEAVCGSVNGTRQTEPRGEEGQLNGLGFWEEGALEDEEEGLENDGQQEDEGECDDEPAWANEDGRTAPLSDTEHELQKKQREMELEQMRQMKQNELQLSRLIGEEQVGPPEGEWIQNDGISNFLPDGPEPEETEDEEVIVFRPASAQDTRHLQLAQNHASATTMQPEKGILSGQDRGRPQPVKFPEEPAAAQVHASFASAPSSVLVPSPSPLVVAAMEPTVAQNARPGFSSALAPAAGPFGETGSPAAPASSTWAGPTTGPAPVTSAAYPRYALPYPEGMPPRAMENRTLSPQFDLPFPASRHSAAGGLSPTGPAVGSLEQGVGAYSDGMIFQGTGALGGGGGGGPLNHTHVRAASAAVQSLAFNPRVEGLGGGGGGNAHARSMALAAGSNGLDLRLLSSLLGLPPTSSGLGVVHGQAGGMEALGYGPGSYGQGQGQGQQFNQAPGMPPYQAGAGSGHPGLAYQQQVPGNGASLESLLGSLASTSTPTPGQGYPPLTPGQLAAPGGGPPYPRGSLGDLATRLYSSYAGTWLPGDSLGLGQSPVSMHPGQHMGGPLGGVSQALGTLAGSLGGEAAASASLAARSATPQQPNQGPENGHGATAGQGSPFALPVHRDPALTAADHVRRSVGRPQNGVIGRTSSGLAPIGTGSAAAGGSSAASLGKAHVEKWGAWTGPGSTPLGLDQAGSQPSLTGGLAGRPASMREAPLARLEEGGLGQNYAWLDEFTHVKPVQDQQWALQDRASLSLWGQSPKGPGPAPSLWSGGGLEAGLGVAASAGHGSANSLRADEGFFPFPGMRSPQPQQAQERQLWQRDTEEAQGRAGHPEQQGLQQLPGGSGFLWDERTRTPPYVP